MTTWGVVILLMVPAASKPAYSPTISYPPALPIINTIAVNIRNITAIDILPKDGI